MGDMIIKENNTVHQVYVLGGQGELIVEKTCHPRLGGALEEGGGRRNNNSTDQVAVCCDNGIPQRIAVERDAKADIVILIMPGVSCDIKMDVELIGEGAEANISGVYVCGGDERVKVAVDMYHKVSHCNSRQLFKGIAGGVSKVDFYGKIIVAKDAQKTEAYQENHNLLLSDGAKVDTKPQLEIYADDVKCSHGATIGRLNEEEQFYMRSRGISLEDAKVLQMISFISPVLENIEDEAQRLTLASRIEESIRQII